MQMSDRMSYGKLAVGLVLVMLIANILLPAPSWAADIDVFATVEGLLCRGSNTEPRFRDGIVVRSLSGGISNPISVGSGAGSSSGKPIPSPLKMVKDFDGCSPLLFRAVVLGERFQRVTISFVTPSNPIVFFEIELINAIVENMTLGANDALAQTAEEVSFTYERMKLTDIALGADGKPRRKVVVECDFVQNSCN